MEYLRRRFFISLKLNKIIYGLKEEVSKLKLLFFALNI
jgi:hypothetical protein